MPSPSGTALVKVSLRWLSSLQRRAVFILVIAFFAALLAGVLSALGLGGGSLLLLYLVEVLGEEQHIAQGINLLFFLPTALFALPAYIKGGYLQKNIILPTTISGVLFAMVGAYVGGNMETALLRKALGGLLLVLGIVNLASSLKK